MKKIVMSISMMLLCILGYAQELPTIVPPSPEATSLAKFTEIPVSHYNGLPTISVPLYNINFEGISIPIGVSYHARGIKVEEIASRVGIGWALNAGGAITRQIRGSDDFGPNGYYGQNFYKDFETDAEVRNYVWTNSLSGNPYPIDLVPDQFIFNFLGYSGKFIFDQEDKKIVLQSYDDLQIEKVGSSNDLGFVIKTSDGFKFYFGEKAISDPYKKAKSKDQVQASYKLNSLNGLYDVSSTSSLTSVNTWHLMEIISPNGEKVTFNYKEENPIFHRRSYDQRKDGAVDSYFSRYRGEQQQLEEIVFNEGRVKFVRGAQRDDLKEGYTLSSIEVESKVGSNYKRVKKYNLNHSYSYNSAIANVNTFLRTDNEAKKRLFLDSIEVIDNNNRSEIYRSFEYTDKNTFPNRFSNEQDYWGYYNGKPNGLFLTNFNQGSHVVSRQVDTVKANVGLIKKMVYPTGGYTSYIFEANKAIMPAYFKDLYYANPNPTTNTRHASLRKDVVKRVSNGTYENAFEIKNTDLGPITVRVNFTGDSGNCVISSANSSISSTCRYRVSVLHENGQPVTGISGAPLHLYSHADGSYTMPLDKLPIGNYKIRVETLFGNDDPNDFENSFSVYLSWFELIDTREDIIYSGGNRIKKIENHSVDNGKITRTYEYLQHDGENETKGTRSSGLIFSLPNYHYIENTVTTNTGATVIVKDNWGARPGSPLSYEQGNHVGYSHVTEYIDADNLQGEGGKTEYQFTAMPDGGTFYVAPYTLASNNEWLRGKPLFIKNYKKDASSLTNYSIVKKEEFTYKYADELSHGILSKSLPTPTLDYVKDRLKFHRPLISHRMDNNDGSTAGAHNYIVYYLSSGVQKLFKKKETTYNHSGEISMSTEYKYDYTNHYQVAGTEITNSQEELYKTENEYNVLDDPNINLFRVLPTRTKAYKGNTKLSEQHTIYTNLGNNNYVPARIQTSKGAQALEDRVGYHSYDSKGNPTEVSKKDGTKIYYVWGYNQTQPIAKIEGYTDTQLNNVQSLINAAIAASNLDDDTCAGLTNCKEKILRDALNAIRNNTNMSTAQVTTFTYDPLIGLTSVTDPRGISMYYKYDDLNRLKYVKDKDENILKETQYNYKN